MKLFVFALCIAFATATPAAVSPYSLLGDLLDFIALIPIDKVQTIAEDHLANDPDMCVALDYLQSDDWTDLVDTVMAKDEVKQLIKYLTDAGLPIDVILDAVNEIIANAKCTATGSASGSLRPLLDDIEAVIPWTDLKDLLDDKMKNSKDFQELYKKVSSQEVHDLVNEIRNMDEVQTLIKRLKDAGVKVDEVAQLLCDFLKWECNLP